MKTSSAKAKGRALQKWVRDKLLEWFPTLDADDVRSTSMGAQGEDIQLSAKARNQFPFTVECKNQEGFKKIYDAYEQAKNNVTKNTLPVVIIKSNRKVPLAIVDAEFFIEAMQQLYYFHKEESNG